MAIAAGDDDEKDDELARLQRLLGMTRTAGAAVEESDDVEDGDEAAETKSGDKEKG